MGCCQPESLRHKCIDDASLEGKEIKNTVVITFAFQVVFTAFNALQNLHSSLHDEESLGNICLAILYGTSIVSSIFSPTLIGLIGAKSAIVASFAAHCIYVLANFYPSFSTMAPAAVALGAFHGPAWTSQALYISASAFSFSKSSSSSPYTVLSRFNGFFFAVFATAQILGNLVTSTIIKDGISNGTDIINQFCGPDDCPHSENATTIEDPEEWVIDITLGFLMACALLGLFLVIFLLSPLPRSEWILRVSVRDTATSCFRVLMTTNMILLVPLIFFTAAEHAFLMSAYTKSYVACPIGIHMVGYVMAVYGVTTPAFVYIFSHLARIAGRFLLLMLSLLTHIFLFIVLFRWTPTSDDIAVIFIIPIVWGVSESILQAQANALIAMLFPSQKEPAFANFHAWRSLGYAITFLNASYMCVSTKLMVCMMFAGLGTVLYVLVEFKAKIKQKLAFRRPRPSLASIALEVDMKQIRNQTTDAWKETSKASLQLGLGRLPFDRVELTDIIMEAQRGWRRDGEGLTLEIGKVMSLEHLADSKVTNWYHMGPIICGYQNPASPRKGGQTGLSRSQSDGHLLYAAEKVDTELQKIRNRERIHTFAVDNKTRTAPNVSRRNVSESATRSFGAIPEVAHEDDFAVENETEIDFGFHSNMNQDDSVFENDDNDIDNSLDEAETKEIMQYRKVLRRLSHTLAKDGIILIGKDIDDCYDESLSSNGQDNLAFDSQINDFSYDGDIMFTDGATSVSANGAYNKSSDSNECHIQNGNTGTLLSMGSNDLRISRLSSNDHGYFSQGAEDTYSLACDIQNIPPEKTFTETVSHKKEQKKSKNKIVRAFKALRKSKKQSKDEDEIKQKASMSEKSQNLDGDENDRRNSNADSNGFADDEFEDNKSYIIEEISDNHRTRQKGVIPINEKEDITCIY